MSDFIGLLGHKKPDEIKIESIINIKYANEEKREKIKLCEACEEINVMDNWCNISSFSWHIPHFYSHPFHIVWIAM